MKKIITRSAALLLCLLMIFTAAACTKRYEPAKTETEYTGLEIITASPETTGAETTSAEAGTEPDTASPPDTEEPETTSPETTNPETAKPETTKPETTKPETTVPETTKPETTVPETEAPKIDENGTYTSKDDVALYIHTYGKLPKNFITKAKAQAAGWDGGGLDSVKSLYGKCIGGDTFGNREKLLPTKSGRKYYECDIDTLHAKARGVKRIVFSNDGLIYYTDDHYESFTRLY